MDNSKQKWPTEVFLPVFKQVERQFKWRKTTSRRITKITKGVLAAQAALEYSISGGGLNVSDQETTSREDC